ncbi:MAG: hypothetical protein GXX79_18705, partial [Actinomycetales bacterium]|nr:hypothetical protein [Actinomycetales bacterium]
MPGGGHDRGQDLLVVGGVLLLTVLAYARTLGNGFIDFDDPESVVDNVTIRELSPENLGQYLTTPLQYMYTPLTSLSYAVDYRIGGLDPGVYHLTNLLLHLGNTVLVLLVVRALTGRALVSRLVTGAFAIHPVNVDAVAWISARGTLLATLFLLGALLAYTGYLRRLADGDRRWHLLALAWVLFVLAALAKSTAVVLPLILLLWDHHLSRRPSWGLLLEKVPFLAVSVVVGLVTLRFRTDLHGTDPYHPVDRFFLFTSVCVAYLRRLVAPHPLSFVYAYPERTGGHLPWQLYLTPLVLCLLVGLLSLLGVPGKVLVLGLSFFLVTLVLTQAVLLADNHQANRHVYLPYLGLYLVGAVLVERVLT